MSSASSASAAAAAPAAQPPIPGVPADQPPLLFNADGTFDDEGYMRSLAPLTGRGVLQLYLRMVVTLKQLEQAYDALPGAVVVARIVPWCARCMAAVAMSVRAADPDPAQQARIQFAVYRLSCLLDLQWVMIPATILRVPQTDPFELSESRATALYLLEFPLLFSPRDNGAYVLCDHLMKFGIDAMQHAGGPTGLELLLPLLRPHHQPSTRESMQLYVRTRDAMGAQAPLFMYAVMGSKIGLVSEPGVVFTHQLRVEEMYRVYRRSYALFDRVRKSIGTPGMWNCIRDYSCDAFNNTLRVAPDRPLQPAARLLHVTKGALHYLDRADGENRRMAKELMAPVLIASMHKLARFADTEFATSPKNRARALDLVKQLLTLYGNRPNAHGQCAFEAVYITQDELDHRPTPTLREDIQASFDLRKNQIVLSFKNGCTSVRAVLYYARQYPNADVLTTDIVHQLIRSGSWLTQSRLMEIAAPMYNDQARVPLLSLVDYDRISRVRGFPPRAYSTRPDGPENNILATWMYGATAAGAAPVSQPAVDYAAFPVAASAYRSDMQIQWNLGGGVGETIDAVQAGTPLPIDLVHLISMLANGHLDYSDRPAQSNLSLAESAMLHRARYPPPPPPEAQQPPPRA